MKEFLKLVATRVVGSVISGFAYQVGAEVARDFMSKRKEEKANDCKTASCKRLCKGSCK